MAVYGGKDFEKLEINMKIYAILALITGASSGFGKDFARLLAERGANLVLVARRMSPCMNWRRRLERTHHIQVRVIGQDLSLDHAAHTLKSRLDEQGIHITTLINNAGFGLLFEFFEQDYARALKKC